MKKMSLFSRTDDNNQMKSILQKNYSEYYERTYNLLKSFIVKYNLDYTVEQLYNELCDKNWIKTEYSKLFPKLAYITDFTLESKLLKLDLLPKDSKVTVESLPSEILKYTKLNNSNKHLYRLKTNLDILSYTYKLTILTSGEDLVAILPQNGGYFKFDGCIISDDVITSKELTVSEALALGFTDVINKRIMPSLPNNTSDSESDMIRDTLKEDILSIDSSIVLCDTITKLISKTDVSYIPNFDSVESFKEALLNANWSIVNKYRSNILVVKCDILGVCNKYTLKELNTETNLALVKSEDGSIRLCVLDIPSKLNKELFVVIKLDKYRRGTILDIDVGGIFNTNSNLVSCTNNNTIISLDEAKALGFTSAIRYDPTKYHLNYERLLQEKKTRNYLNSSEELSNFLDM